MLPGLLSSGAKGIVENLVGYAKRDVPHPMATPIWRLGIRRRGDWCAERNSVEHSEIVPSLNDRLGVEIDLLRPLSALRPRIGRPEIRKVDKLSTIRVASARYSVPFSLVGVRVEPT